MSTFDGWLVVGIFLINILWNLEARFPIFRKTVIEETVKKLKEWNNFWRNVIWRINFVPKKESTKMLEHITNVFLLQTNGNCFDVKIKKWKTIDKQRKRHLWLFLLTKWDCLTTFSRSSSHNSSPRFRW
jgi:hypothetical protein